MTPQEDTDGYLQWSRDSDRRSGEDRRRNDEEHGQLFTRVVSLEVALAQTATNLTQTSATMNKLAEYVDDMRMMMQKQTGAVAGATKVAAVIAALVSGFIGAVHLWWTLRGSRP